LAGAGTIRALASGIVLSIVVFATPALPQTTNAPFGDVAHHVVRLDGVRFHYVTAGSGEPVVLLPGWPGSWIAWRKMIPLFVSAGRQGYVLDPRGLGDGDKPQSGYDLHTGAREQHSFPAATGQGPAAAGEPRAHPAGVRAA